MPHEHLSAMEERGWQRERGCCFMHVEKINVCKIVIYLHCLWAEFITKPK